MDKRFLTIWATVSVGGSFISQSTNKPLEMSVLWAFLGLIAATADFQARKQTKNK